MMKEEILERLLQEKDYVSGEALSQSFGVSRAAIWKSIQALREQGYPVEAATRKGYRLSAAADVLTKHVIEEKIKQLRLQDQLPFVIYEDTVVSTNLTAKQQLEQLSDGQGNHLIAAARQTGGKGRRGRSWLSDHEAGLWFSLLLQPSESPEIMARATLLTGLAVVRAMTEIWQLPVGIKWPNDLICLSDGKKAGGILSEILLEDQSVKGLIIGIGINLNSRHFPDEITDIATSMQLIKPGQYKRVDVLGSIVDQFFKLYPHLAHMERWLPDYKKNCLTLGQQVRAISFNGQIIEGTAVDIDQEGELVISGHNGKTHTVRSGEVSVRGLLGE